MRELLETLNHIVQLMYGHRYTEASHGKKVARAIQLLQMAKVSGTSKILLPVFNELQSIQRALAAGDILAPAPKLVEVKKAQRAISNKLKDVINGTGEEQEHSQEEDEVHAIEDMIKRNAVEAPKVQLGNRPFAIHKVPVVLTSPANVETLKRLGFKAEYMSGYVVIHNQLVVGISPRLARESSFIQEAQAVLDTYSKVRKQRFHLMSDNAYRYGGAAWYWAANERDINAMRRAMGGSLNITDWGFSFR